MKNWRTFAKYVSNVQGSFSFGSSFFWDSVGLTAGTYSRWHSCEHLHAWLLHPLSEVILRLLGHDDTEAVRPKTQFRGYWVVMCSHVHWTCSLVSAFSSAMFCWLTLLISWLWSLDFGSRRVSFWRRKGGEGGVRFSSKWASVRSVSATNCFNGSSG